MAQYRLTFANLGWRGRVGLVVVSAIGLALAGALIVLSLGLFIVLIPLVAVAFAVGRWRLARMMNQAAERQQANAPRTIETDYKVIEGENRDRR